MNFFDEAREYLFKSLVMNENIGRFDRVASRYSDIGESYLAQQNTKEAKKYLFQSLAKFKELKLPEREYLAVFNLALCHEIEKNLDSAYYYYATCEKIGLELSSDEILLYAWAGLGSIANQKEKIDEAEILLSKSLNLAEAFHNTQVMRDVSISLAEVYEKKREL